MELALSDPKKVLSFETKAGNLKIWQLLAALAGTAAVLCVLAAVIPKISIPKIEFKKPAKHETAQVTEEVPIDVVTNTEEMLYISSSVMNNYVLRYQEAYSDGTMIEERVADECITVKLYRRIRSADGIYGHLNDIYPEIAGSAEFAQPDEVTVRDTVYSRIKTSAPALTADGKNVDIVMLSSDVKNTDFDFVLTIETPQEYYNLYKDRISLWIYSLDVVPAAEGNYVSDDSADLL